MSENLAVKPTSSIKTIALAGNPNSGKTTLFNAFTKLRQKVGNYPGVTVEKKSGSLALAKDRVVNVLDLPGTYSLAVRSPDEKIARDVLLGRALDTPKPDMVICVVDANNLERNLYLVSQIQDLGLPLVIALNMMDEVRRDGKEIDVQLLSKEFGVPVVPMVASQNKGIEEIKQVIAQGVEANYRRKWLMAPDLEKQLEQIVRLLKHHEGFGEHEAFSEAVAILSVGRTIKKSADSADRFYKEELINQINLIQEDLKKQGLRVRSAAVEARYEWIKSVIHKVIIDHNKQRSDLTDKIDAVLTNKFLGLLIFVGLMGLIFYMIFTIATYPMDWIDAAFGTMSDFVMQTMPEGDLRDLVANGIIAGVGGVVIFLPQILILFFFIGLLQDTGYMARAAFIMDRVMSKVGLHGKSFIPLLSSFACAIPGIMAARTIESNKDRLVTILIAPLMSCSARLPVYMIMIAVLIPGASSLEKAGIMLAMYLLGITGAGVMAWVFKSTLLKRQKPIFIMELPPYRFPSLKAILLHMWERSRLFLKRAGTVILAMSVLLWALMTYPKHDTANANDALKQSYAGRIGAFLEPAIKPLGYDWRIGVGLVGSFAAREVFVSTMSIVFNLDEDEDTAVLRDAFRQAKWPDGRPLFTPLVCISIMIFFVFALQCMSTIAVVWRETGGWQWPLFQLSYMTALAYAAAFAVFHIGRMLGFQ
ncbi:MAG: ferrous iron transport protein B [Omnitrophica WOR_2 bacterium RIFCSPHIGHO2_02_FULL_52_10]|nr:MAG: ferrous iron transport protein B [Omnitrophica WOR_2 bacterium RIFCSPHIGHO2_02_FULL_52_10]